jgi:uncharacterized membrane protein HdeD (DUF308 family)
MDAERLAEHMRHNWWVWAVRGLTAVLFGTAAFAWPGMTLLMLIWLFGANALVGGFFTLVSAVKHREEYGQWWLLLLSGVLSIGAGLVAYFYPGLTGLTLLYVIAAWAAVTGVLEIISAIRWRKVMEHTGLFLVSGIMSVLFGFLATAYPGAGALGILWLIGAYSIAFGVLLISFGFRVRHWGELVAGGKMRHA